MRTKTALWRGFGAWRTWHCDCFFIRKPSNDKLETPMKMMKKATNGAANTWTLGELVTLAYDVAPNRKAAVKLLGLLLGGRPMRVRIHSGG